MSLRRRQRRSQDAAGSARSPSAWAIVVTLAIRAELGDGAINPAFPWNMQCGTLFGFNDFFNEESYLISCPAGCGSNPLGAVYGSHTYASWSVVCTAAVHSGAISDTGGEAIVHLKKDAWTMCFTSSLQNGVQSWECNCDCASCGDCFSPLYFQFDTPTAAPTPAPTVPTAAPTPVPPPTPVGGPTDPPTPTASPTQGPTSTASETTTTNTTTVTSSSASSSTTASTESSTTTSRATLDFHFVVRNFDMAAVRENDLEGNVEDAITRSVVRTVGFEPHVIDVQLLGVDILVAQINIIDSEHEAYTIWYSISHSENDPDDLTALPSIVKSELSAVYGIGVAQLGDLLVGSPIVGFTDVNGTTFTATTSSMTIGETATTTTIAPIPEEGLALEGSTLMIVLAAGAGLIAVLLVGLCVLCRRTGRVKKADNLPPGLTFAVSGPVVVPGAVEERAGSKEKARRSTRLASSSASSSGVGRASAITPTLAAGPARSKNRYASTSSSSTAPTNEVDGGPRGIRVATMGLRVPEGVRGGTMVQAMSPIGTSVRFQVPKQAKAGDVISIDYHVPDDHAVAIDEEEQFATCVALAWPMYWTNMRHPNNLFFDQMFYVKTEHERVFQQLMKETYVRKVTQDRRCPTGKCPQTKGGCPCVKVGGIPGLPVNYRVRRVIRVEDSRMWSNYVDRRNAIRYRRHDSLPLPAPEPKAKTDEIAHQHPEVFEPLDSSINELYLWHGTDVRKALSIAQTDFDLAKVGKGGAGSGGGMYGPGAYFAESSTKADEYAKDEPDGYYEDVFALLLCRVCMGRYYYTTGRDDQVAAQVRGNGEGEGEYDSVFGDREASARTFREFVVYDSAALYPEYIVLYTREHQRDNKEELKLLYSKSLHMQLPVYWSNCHRSPEHEPFHDQFKVRRFTLTLLQRLATASLGDATKTVTVLSARRVENSSYWNGYVKFKQQLQQELRDRKLDAFTSAAALTAKLPVGASGMTARSNSRPGWEVMTHQHLQDEHVEESISISNMDQSLNEYLLWHGTARESAESITRREFDVSGKSGEKKRGQRFGNGAYLAEDLAKSLTYAPPDADGLQTVLLCRVLCGSMLYTEDNMDEAAAIRREEENKHSILAHPQRLQSREFIVPRSCQVYPEYILEVRTAKAEKKASGKTSGTAKTEKVLEEPPPPEPVEQTKVHLQVPSSSDQRTDATTTSS